MTNTIPPHQINYSTFILFHPSTNGTSGRKVYIDPALIPRFIELIDPNDHIGLQVIQGLIGLKNSAAGINSDSNQSNALQHRSTFQNVVVTYTILQQGGRGAGVYITAFASGYQKDLHSPGLYKVKPSAERGAKWAVEPDSSSSMPSVIGVLGSAAPSESGIVSATETADVFVDSALSRERRQISNGFSLFYTPHYVIDGMGVWLSSTQKISNPSAGSPKSFAQLLANTANKPAGYGDPERYKWYIVGQGAKFFQQALQEYKRIGKTQLNRNHEFYFVDPQVPLGLLKDDLRSQGIDFYHDRNIIEDKMTLAGRINQFVDPTETYRNLHRAATLEKVVIESVAEANKIYKTRESSSVYFCDVIKKLSGALSRRWG